MSDVKMSKWFKLPVDCSHIVDDTDVVGSADSISIDGYTVLTDHHIDKVATAINAYDSNQELIAKQQVDIELLRKAMASLIELSIDNATEIDGGWGSCRCADEIRSDGDLDDEIINAEKALAATKKG